VKDQLSNLEKKLNKIEWELYFNCKPLECLGFDENGNYYWLFEEEKFSLLQNKADNSWEIIRGNFKKILDSLNEYKMNEQYLRLNIINAIKKGFLIPTSENNIQKTLARKNQVTQQIL